MMGPGGAIEYPAVTIVAAADNSGKSRVPLHCSFVTVSAYTTNADDWIILPTGVKEGHTIRAYSAVGHEIRTEAGSDIKINDVDSDGGTKEAAITGTWHWEAMYLGSTGWVLKAWSKAGAEQTAIVPD